MNPRTRALITVGLVITILTLFFLFIFVRQQKQAFLDTVHNEQYGLQSQMALLLEQTAQRYKSRIKSLATNRVRIIRAFANKDRQELLKQASPLLKLFKKEDAYFKGLFFANPDNTIFLRVGMPEIYGDDVTHLSPLVPEVNRLKKMMAGFEITKPGLNYRILYPIFADGEYIGLLGFIIDADFFLNQLHQTSHACLHNDSQNGTEIALVFPRSELDKAVFLNKTHRIIGNYVVFSDSNSHFQELPDHINLDQTVQRVKFHGKTHALIQTGNFKNFKGNVIATGFSLMDIENIVAETKRTIVLTIIFSFGLLFFSFVIIYFNFNILFKKITELNNSLTKSNKELEHRVEKRTADLQKEITERKGAEVSLMNSEEKYRSMMESMKDPVYICSPDYLVEYANPAMIKRIGRDVTGENCFKALHNLNRKCPWCVHNKNLKGKQIESEIVSPLDNRSYHITHSPIVHTNGSISKMTVFRDITEQKTMQKALKEASSIINKSPAVAFLWKNNQGWPVEFVSENVKELSGYSPKDFISGEVSYMDVIHPEDLERVIEEVSTSGNKKGKMDFAHKPYRIVTRKGDVKWIDDRTFIREDRKGIITHYEGIVIDITDQKKLEEEKKELRLQLQQTQKMEAIGTLAGGIAHDFNNILFPIMGHTEMLMADVAENSPIQERLANIYAGAIRARDLVKQILTFSRQGSSELILMKMQPVIKEVLKLIRSTIPTTIDIKSYINPDCGVIKADPTQIHQIVMNLVTNAYHAMEKAGGELKVSLDEIEFGEYDRISPEMNPGVYACLKVADTGRGMNKELIKKIFDPFFTTKEKGKGTGMGLSVVHGMVKNMGSTIQVYSEPGIGTEFKVYFPVEKSSFEKTSVQSYGMLQGGSEQILLLDDEEEILTMEKQMLERLGYQVTTLNSSIDALDAFRRNPDKFDLVITDMAMPNMSGDKLSVELTIIRPDIPVLLCTGFSETMSEEKAASLGIKGFLLKPIVMKDLAQKIRGVLDENKN